MRENIRSFTVADTFEDLIKKIDDHYCIDNVEKADFQYPIVGKIGVGEMVDTFVRLSLFDGLGGPENNRKGPPTMADTIAFTTTISGSVNPKVVLSPVRHGLTDATVMASVSRQDLHKVIVGLSLPDAKDAEKPGGAKDLRRTSPGTLIAARGTSAELNAALAIQQQIYRFDLRNATIIFSGSGALVN